MSVPTSQGPSPGIFPTTIWSEVRAGGGRGRERELALESLARRYQGPAEVFLRAALGVGAERARELFQGFFAWMLETGFLERADPGRGSFRAFLKLALRRYALDEFRRDAAGKRGGARGALTLDREHETELADRGASRPEELLDRAWRAELVREALERTRGELESEGRALVHAVFRDYYLAPGQEVDYRALAERHGITTTDVSNHLMRAKRVYRARLRALVLDTVRSAGELDEELRWLLGEEP